VHVSERLDKKFSAHYEFGDRREWVTSARTYFYEDEHVCDNNVTHFIDGIDTASGPFYAHDTWPTSFRSHDSTQMAVFLGNLNYSVDFSDSS